MPNSPFPWFNTIMNDLPPQKEILDNPEDLSIENLENAGFKHCVDALNNFYFWINGRKAEELGSLQSQLERGGLASKFETGLRSTTQSMQEKLDFINTLLNHLDSDTLDLINTKGLVKKAVFTHFTDLLSDVSLSDSRKIVEAIITLYKGMRGKYSHEEITS